jgi:DNA-binding winged helix-turn-helix (wHTH) protein
MQIGFEDCLLDTDRRELRRGSELVALEPQVFDDADLPGGKS